MAPPALAIVGGVVVVAGMTVAFHHFIYEPHIAPKLEILVENWLEKRRTIRRRVASVVSATVDSDDDGGLPMRTYSPRQDKTISTSLKVTSIDTETNPASLRRRTKPATGGEASVIETPNNFIPFDPLNPATSITANLTKKLNIGSRSSTPSTIPSSILAMHSPSVLPGSPKNSDAQSDHSRSASSFADSILADPTHVGSPAHSPVHSVTHISPRTLFITLSPTTSSDGERSPTFAEEGHPSSAVYPSLTYFSAQEHLSRGTSPTSSSSPNEITNLSQFVSVDGLLLPGSRTPRSSASWSDIASNHGDEPEFLIGSDVESWANLSDRA